jgi:putative alpha-1,2-mannosidase
VGNSKDNVYVQSVLFEGTPLENCWIDRKQLMKGGNLVFEMGNQPDYSRGTAIPPPSMSQKSTNNE